MSGIRGDARKRAQESQPAPEVGLTGCACPPCPGRGNDGHGMTHCAECCFGSGVEADIDCPTHGEVGLTEAEREALDEQFGDAFTVAWERAVARIKADAIQQERAAWVAKVEAALEQIERQSRTCKFNHASGIRVLLSSDATEAHDTAKADAARQALLDAADEIDRGPTFPLPPSVISELIRERAARLNDGSGS